MTIPEWLAGFIGGVIGGSLAIIGLALWLKNRSK